MDCLSLTKLKREDSPAMTKCYLCKLDAEVMSCYVIDSKEDCKDVAEAYAHLSCIRSKLNEDLKSKSSSDFKSLYSYQDMFDVLGSIGIENFMDQLTCEFLKSDERFSQCPSCTTYVEADFGDLEDSVDPNMKGIDGKLLNSDALRHYSVNRIKCQAETCKQDFCFLCKATPYHSGFDCQSFKVFQSAPKCRFCGNAVMNKLRLSSSGVGFEAFQNVSSLLLFSHPIGL